MDGTLLLDLMPVTVLADCCNQNATETEVNGKPLLVRNKHSGKSRKTCINAPKLTETL